jgi:hypothetical protein
VTTLHSAHTPIYVAAAALRHEAMAQWHESMGGAAADDVVMVDDAADGAADAVEEVTRGLRTISFESLVSGSEGVRVTDDVPPKIWAVDLVMVVTGKNRNEAGLVLRRLNSDVFDTIKMIDQFLPGNGKWPVKLLTFEHALELVMVLPGTAAKAFRVQACDILKRYFAGDQTLHAEVDSNATSTAPLNAFARASLEAGLPAAKRPRIGPTTDVTTVVYQSRNDFIRDACAQYMELNGVSTAHSMAHSLAHTVAHTVAHSMAGRDG